MMPSFNLTENGISKKYFCYIPILSSPLLPVPYINPRDVRPDVFHNFFTYVFAEASGFQRVFNRFVQLANRSSAYTRIERFKEALVAICDEHIKRYQRLVFIDLLKYADIMGFVCSACGEMSADSIKANYGKWVKMVVDKRWDYIKSSTDLGPGQFSGSQNEADLLSCLD